MPATVKVKICEARHLPVMDRSGETTDAFVEVRLANNVFKTEVCRKSLDPRWDSDWFKFEVNDVELQEEPLQMRVMDYDTYSSHDAIGKVYVDLTNMLVSENRSTYAGWLPIYDTLLGIRGQLKIEVRLVPFCVDMRTLWHLSNSILFFSSALFPSGFRVKRIIGLVDHTLVADDPEHQWMDKIRTPRSTNEARQFLFMRMSGELRRKIGNKVVEFGGNAVVALRQRIDLGHMGVIFRAVGTAVVVEKLGSDSAPNQDVNDPVASGMISPGKRKVSTLETVPGSPVDGASVPAAKVEDSHSADGERSPTNMSEIGKMDFERSAKFYLGNSQESDQQENARISVSPEFPFLTLKHLPAGLVKSLGGTVSCKMIKTLERLEQDDINQAPYALWWKELRAEICRLMRSVGCNAVYGYSEELSLTDDGNIQLLCASGTAAVLDVDLTKERDGEGPESTWNAVMPRENLRKESSVLHYPEALGQTPDCKIFHIPSGEYSDHVAPTSAMCGSCRIGHVPDILLTTVEVPDGTPIRGTGTFIQAKVQRKTKALKGESGARELSETLPFVEFELHSQINTKLKLLGLNAVFNLRVDIQCGAETVVACATGTGVFIVALPKSLRPTVSDGRKPGLETVDMQAKLDALMDQQMRQLGLGEEKEGEVKAGKSMRTTRPTMVKKKKAATGSRQYSKSGFVIDLEDDGFEGQSVFSLMDFLPPKDTLLFGSEICPMADRMKSLRSSENVAAGSNRFPGSIVQNICRIWRTSLMNDQDEMIDVAATFRHLLNDVVFRARVYRPCRICGLEFRMQISPGDSLLLLLQGSIVTEPLPLYGVLRGTTEVRRIMRHAGSRAGLSGAEDANETVPVIRILPEDSFTQETAPKDSLHPKPPASMASRCRIHPSPRATPIFSHLSQPQTTQHVEISSLSFVHTGTVKRYVGNLNLVVLRECQTLRENDGLSGFMQRALADFYAIVRSQTVAAGGNAVLSFQLAQVQLADSYNQAQCIMHASGDMVELEEAVSAGSLES